MCMCVEPEDALACHPQLYFLSSAWSWPAGLESLSSETQEFSYLHLLDPGIQLHHHAWHFYNVSSGARTQVFVIARQRLPTESPPQPWPRFLSCFHLCRVHAYMSQGSVEIRGQLWQSVLSLYHVGSGDQT